MQLAWREVKTMFPAHAGMNRTGSVKYIYCYHVPRTRGDEPRTVLKIQMFS